MANNLEIIKNVIVRQSNHLVESPYMQEFTAYGIKLFEIAIASCTKDDNLYVERKSDKEFQFNNNQLAKLLNTKPNVISMEIEKTAKQIMDKKLHLRKVLEDGSIEFEMINIIPYAKYQNGVLTFRLNYAIIPYLLEINKNFTEFQLHYLLKMNSAYAIKLYKLLCQYKKIKARIFTVDNLKEQFGLKHKYKQYNDLKKNIVLPSILQINTKTDLYVEYKEIKSGRKVSKIEFNFKLQNKPVHTDFTMNTNEIIDVKPLIDTDSADISKLLGEIDSKIATTTKTLLTKYYKDKGIEYVEASINYAVKNAKTNLDKYLSDTLTNGWAEVEVKQIIDKKTETQKQKELAKQKKLQEVSKLEYAAKNKLEIEEEWFELSADEAIIYADHANRIIAKHQNILKMFPNISQDLPICCYAVSNDKTYNATIEGYCKTILLTDIKVI